MERRARNFGLVLSLTIVAGGLMGCAAVAEDEGRARSGSDAAATLTANSAHAELRDRDGRSVGRAVLTNTEHGVRIEVQVTGLSAGRHGFHIHETGRCDPPDFTSAGGHFNPGTTHHGMENPAGPHGGDLPNLVAGADGSASLSTINPYLTLGTGAANDLLRAGGTSVMIHAGPDDYYTDPAGDSGARVICGVVEKDS